MVIRDDHKDTISIDLSELFGKVMTFSAKDAERMQPDNPALILVMTYKDDAEFRTYVDKVVMDMTSRIAHLLDQGSIVKDWPYLNIEFSTGCLNPSGLHIIDEAMQSALTYGVLSEYQAGAPGYEIAEQANKDKYAHALGALSASSLYRRQSPNRAKIKQRFF